MPEEEVEPMFYTIHNIESDKAVSFTQNLERERERERLSRC